MGGNIIEEISDEIEDMLNKQTNISDILFVWQEIDFGMTQFKILKELAEKKIMDFMNERDWTTYQDDISKVSVKIIDNKEMEVNRSMLRMLLNKNDLAQVMRAKTKRELQIVSAQARARLKKIASRQTK